jgi:hypothetical protein
MSYFYTLFFTDESGVVHEQEFAARNTSHAIDHVRIQCAHGKQVMRDVKLLDSFSNELTPSGGWL